MLFKILSVFDSLSLRVSSRIFCLGGKNSLESLTTPTFVGTLYWHVINLFCTTTLGYLLHCVVKYDLM